MRIARWNPFHELEEMSERLARLTGRQDPLVADWAPLVDIQETPKEYLIKAELPEIKKDDVHVFIKDGILTMEGERKNETEDKGKTFHRVERSYGKFIRCFRVPEDADEKNVKAQFEGGLLTVHLGKGEAAHPRSIEIKLA